ncbi:hypothetical protein [Allorhizocola rhizosphaerae]|nr:hypothetical protein [Allorhizocola rhizosphaerae]
MKLRPCSTARRGTNFVINADWVGWANRPRQGKQLPAQRLTRV